VLGFVQIKTKRHEDQEQIRGRIIADLNRAIELDPENGEYYYLRYSMRGEKSDLDRAEELDPSIAEALSDRQSLSDFGDNELLVPAVSPAFSWEEFLANPPKPKEIKERWRLKCLRD
jgi:hypothetical protein